MGGGRWHGILWTVEHACQGRRALWLLCLDCGHSRRMDPRKLIAKYGDRRITELAVMLHCRSCGGWHGAVVPDDRPMTDWPPRNI